MTRIDLLMLYKRLRHGWVWVCPYPGCSNVGRKSKSFLRRTNAKHNGVAHINLIHSDRDTAPILVRMYKTVVYKEGRCLNG